jgi:hypothetical protein
VLAVPRSIAKSVEKCRRRFSNINQLRRNG